MTAETLSLLVFATGLEAVRFGSAVRINRNFMYPIEPAVITSIKNELENC